MTVDRVDHADRVDTYTDPPLARRGNALSLREDLSACHLDSRSPFFGPPDFAFERGRPA